MAVIRRILWYLRPFNRSRMPRRGYSEEVLYASWVNTPKAPRL